MNSNRQYFIDWLRVIAIGLLMVYHVAIVFQPWGLMIGFITNLPSWEKLWIPMTMLNVWRIPLLFFISGIGVYFSFQNRTWQELIKERSLRILVPLIFGIFTIVPIYMFLLQIYYQWTIKYTPNPAHLWFLGNIFIYIAMSLPILNFLRRQQNNVIVRNLKILLSNPLGLLLVISSFVVEVILVKPMMFELYAMTWHGFFLGLLAFLWGYSFAWIGISFWEMLAKYRWLILSLAILFYILRLMKNEAIPQDVHLPIESCLWIFSIFGMGYRYLNKSNSTLMYLTKAAYPVYILHMIFIALTAMLILPLHIDVALKFILLLIGTISGSSLCYEFIIKRKYLLKFLFGLK